MKKSFGLVVFIFLSSCKYFEFQHHPWLIYVESTYTDTKNPKLKTTFKGHGFVIEAQKRHFVITASHLSQGGLAEGKSSVALKYFKSDTKSFENLKILKRSAQNSRDVEVLEIEVPANSNIKALAQWINPRELGPSEAAQFPAGKFLIQEEFSAPILNEEVVETTGFVPLGLKAFIPRTRHLTETLETPHSGRSYAELQRIFTATDSFLLRYRIDSGLELVNGEVFAETALKPGMSGLPLILKTVNYDAPYQEKQALLGAIVTSGSRYFSNGWLTHELYLGTTLIALLRDLTFYENITWHCQDGVLYRKGTLSSSLKPDLKLHFQEALFIDRNKTGGGERADGGSGERADGGSGERADGGTQAKLPTALLKGGMAFVLNTSSEVPKSLNHISAYEVTWNSQQLILPADMSSLNWIIDQIDKGKISIDGLRGIGIDENLTELLWKRWQKNFLIKEPTKTFEIALTGEQLTPFEKYKKFSPLLKLNYDQNLNVQINMGFDSIEFKMAPNGGIIGVTKDFQNIVTLRSANGIEYSLDLADMFMTALSKIPYKSSINQQMRLRFKIKNNENEFLFWNNL